MLEHGNKRKLSWSNLRYYLEMCRDMSRKTTRNVGENCRCLGQDSNQASPEYKSEVSPLELTGSVNGSPNLTYGGVGD
jgi:hypothetical protein